MSETFCRNRLLYQEIILGKIRWIYSENMPNVFSSGKQAKASWPAWPCKRTTLHYSDLAIIIIATLAYEKHIG